MTHPRRDYRLAAESKKALSKCHPENTRETQQEQMTEEDVLARLERRMTEKFGLVYRTAAAFGLRMRETVLYLALKSVCRALEAKGAQS
jgi:glutamate dehydrogenase/leucine dehydrogenase